MMNQFVPGYKNSYEEIKTYYPMFYRRLEQMDALWQAYGDQVDNLKDAINQFVLNQFIYECDADTVYLWEEFLELGHDYTKTLKDRKRSIIATLIGGSHIGRPEIMEIVGIFTDAQPTVAFYNGVVTVSFEGDVDSTFRISDLYDLLYKKLPAHLTLTLDTRWGGNKVLNEYAANLFRMIIRARVNNGYNGDPVLPDKVLRLQCLKTGLSIENSEQITVFMTVDSMWQLDGSMLLDGSRTLDAEYTRSEV